MPLLGLRRGLPRHDLQRPVEARETSAVGQQWPCGTRPLRPRRVAAHKSNFAAFLLVDLRTGGRDLFECFEDWVIQYGMPHHVIICQGHHKASLAKFASARGVKIV